MSSDPGRFGAALPKLLAEVACELTTSAVASRIATSFVLALGARTARVYLSRADRGTLDLAASEDVDFPASASAMGLSAIGDDLSAATAVRLGLVQVSDAADATAFRRPREAGAARARGGVELALPLFAGAATIGAVSAVFDELALSDCAALTMLSAPLGAIVDGARVRGELARLEALGRKREERMALVIHELRQPLQLLILAAGRLANRSKDDEQRSLDLLRSGGRRLDGLISDLGDASFLESGSFSLHVSSTDVTSLVEAFVGRLAPTALVSVDGEIPLMDVDPQRIGQILTNLIGNAQKYGSSEIAPRVVVARRDRLVVVSVTNDGDGISEDERTMVFEPYYRGRARKPETRGQGLGLYICRMLVEEHGGRIWTDGDSCHTRFSFSLPVPELVQERVSETRCRATQPALVSCSCPAWGSR